MYRNYYLREVLRESSCSRSGFGSLLTAKTQEGNGIFSGLAHWIKGGIFFWLGIFTLGRWSGSFGELGWVCIPISTALSLAC